MRRRVMVLAVASALLCVSTAYLFFRVRTTAFGSGRERELLAENQRLRADRQSLESELRALREVSAHTTLRQQGDGTLTSFHAAKDSPQPASSGGWRPPELAAKLSGEQRRFSLRQRNGELFRELGLTEGEIDALIPVLAAQEERFASLLEHSSSARPASGAESPMARNQAEIVSVLGPEKAARFADLRKTLPVRAEVRRTRDELEQAGEPLTDAQERELIAKVGSRPPLAPLAHVTGEPIEDTRERARDLAAERAQHLRADMASVLSPAQLKIFDGSQELRSVYDALPARARNAAAPPIAGTGALGTLP